MSADNSKARLKPGFVILQSGLFMYKVYSFLLGVRKVSF